MLWWEARRGRRQACHNGGTSSGAFGCRVTARAGADGHGHGAVGVGLLECRLYGRDIGCIIGHGLAAGHTVVGVERTAQNGVRAVPRVGLSGHEA
ncbi:hypothetical protein HYQ46_003793 [Verticillium longisporum]|nr:hypothetical protein HYQ46_003793 [Verticillium longisporum]